MRGTLLETGGFDRRVWLLVGAMAVFRFGHGLYFPFSSIYFHNVVGIPLSLVGVGLAALAVASIVSGLVAGPLSDRWGRKPVMMVALVGSVVSFGLFSRVEGFAGYLAVSVGAGLAGMTLFDAARNAMVADVTPPGRRGRAYGLVRVGGNVGWALGPMVAGFVSAAGDGTVYPRLFVGTAALSAVVAAVVALGVRESRPAAAVRDDGAVRWGAPRLREAFSDGRLVLLLVAGVLLYYVFTQDWQAVPVYARNFAGVGDGAVGFLLGANGLMVILLQIPISGIIDRGSRAVALLAGAGLFALSSLTLLLTDSFVGILIAFAGFFTLAEMVLEVAGAAYAAEIAPERLRGTYLALFGTCFGVSYGVSPIVAGSLLGAGVPDAVWGLQLGASVLAAAVLLAMMRRKGARA